MNVVIGPCEPNTVHVAAVLRNTTFRRNGTRNGKKETGCTISQPSEQNSNAQNLCAENEPIPKESFIQKNNSKQTTAYILSTKKSAKRYNNMKFGKTLRDKTLKEWRFYAVDYKALKKALKDGDCGHDAFFRLVAESESKLSKFYHDKETWAFDYMKILLERVQALRDASPMDAPTDSESSSSSESSLVTLAEEEEYPALTELDEIFTKLSIKAQSFGTKQAWLKEEYRRMGSSKQFKAFIYAKKSLATFDRELDLLMEFSTSIKLPLVRFSKSMTRVQDQRFAKRRCDRSFWRIVTCRVTRFQN